MTNIPYILGALVLFGVIVFAHELGHYLAARATGIVVEEFSIGFGPKIFGWRRHDIDYSLRALPLGGYCRFLGEDSENDDPRAMNKQKVWKRLVTVVSGPLMNFVLAYLAVVLYLTLVGTMYTVPKVAGFTEGFGAEAAGMRVGDVIVEVEGRAIEYGVQGAYDLREAVQGASVDQDIHFTVERDGELLTVPVRAQKTDEGVWQIGILMGAETYRFPLIPALGQSFITIREITVLMLDSFKQLFSTGEGLDQTMGPVGIISMVSQEIRQGFGVALNLIVMISLNLGILNLLPLPALDGGRLVFLLVEAVRRKPVKPEYEGWVHAAGFMLLIGLILVITYRDIARLITGG